MDNLLERVVQLEIDFAKITVVNENIDRRLILLENLLTKGQETINEIKHQLEIKNERIRIFKNILTGLLTVGAAILGLHARDIIEKIFS